MLDVHPPHHPTHTWKDFFIHIATIVIGLLIAVGLEQSVEYIHHRRDLAETRRTLARERELNKALLKLMTEEYGILVPQLVQDVAIYRYLRDHPGAPPETWPGRLVFGGVAVNFDTSAWKVAEKGTVLQYMPQKELRLNDDLYQRMDVYNMVGQEQMRWSSDFGPFRNPTMLTPAQIDQAIDMLNKDIAIQARLANGLRNLHSQFPDFPPPPVRVALPASFNSPVPTPPEVVAQQEDLAARINKLHELEDGEESSHIPDKAADPYLK